MKNRIEALTGTRAIAALLVVVFHYGCTVFPFNKLEHLFRQGNLAVGYFFVLSGFVMYWSYHSKAVSYGGFLKRRLGRIWPLYVFAILLAIAHPVYSYWQYNISLPDNFISSLVLNITMLQAYVPGYALTINSPGWSLSVEFFFYLLFPLLLWFSKKDQKSFVRFAWLFFILSQALHLWMINTLNPVYPSALFEFIYYQPIMHLNAFLLGMVGAYYFLSGKRVMKVHPFILTVLIVLIIYFVPDGISLHNGLLAPLFLCLILSVASMTSGIVGIKLFVFLGEISYGIYILQEPLHFLAEKMNMKWLHLSELPFFYTYLCLLMLFSTLSYYCIEIPVRKLITKK